MAVKNVDKLRSQEFLLQRITWIILMCFKCVSTTEVTASPNLIDKSLGIDIALPVLTCHAKHSGYKNVFWYKDYKLVKNGSAGLVDHILSLASLLDTDSEFNHPLKLQGYFWCETDVTSVVHNYLFRIKEVNTYAGRFVSSHDSLGEDDELKLEEKIKLKMKIYEDEMQNTLFGFLPAPNTYVTDIRDRKKGLEVRFYLYSRLLFHPREPFAHQLVQDADEMEYVMEYISNETENTDQHLYREITAWTEFRGIDVRSIVFRSTLGCYAEKTLVPADPPKEVSWPHAYISDVVIPDEACSSKSGLAVTRMCTGSFYSGARWGNPSGKCDTPPGPITSRIKDLYDTFGDEAKPDYIKKLLEVTEEAPQFSVTDLHILTNILKELSLANGLQSQDIGETFSVIDGMVETNSSELTSAKSTIRLTSRLLQIINNILKLATDRHAELLISRKNLLVDVKTTKISDNGDTGHIVGLAVLQSEKEGTLENSSVEFLINGTKGPEGDSLAYFLLPTDLVVERETELPFPCQIKVVFFREWTLFPNPKGVLAKRNYKVLPSPVISVSLSGGPVWNLTTPAELYFKNTYATEIEHPVCVYFDSRLEDGEGAWNTEGCEYTGLHEGFYHCRCHHLSIFAVILSVSPEIESVTYKLGTAVYVACSISIIGLALTVLLYLLSKTWRSTVDHSILFWLSVSFFCCILLIFISEMKFRWKSSCFLLSILLHYSILVTFSWLLVHAVVHRLRFAKKTDMAEVSHFTLKAVICTWGTCAFIMLIVWITRDYKYYNAESCFSALADTSRAAVIPTVLLILVTLCINLCAVYAVTCRFQKDYLLDDSTYHESVIKFRIAFTIFFFFVMSWLFGFFALHHGYKELRILFSISITITAYYVTLFFIFQETSLWEMFRRCKKSDAKTEGEVVTFIAKK